MAVEYWQAGVLMSMSTVALVAMPWHTALVSKSSPVTASQRSLSAGTEVVAISVQVL